MPQGRVLSRNPAVNRFFAWDGSPGTLKSLEFERFWALQRGRVGPYGFQGQPTTNVAKIKDRADVRCLQARVCSLRRPSQNRGIGRSHRVLRRRPKVRPSHRQSARRCRRTGGARRQGRTLHRQERRRARPDRSGGTEGRPPGGDRRRQDREPAAEGSTQARRARHGQAAARRERRRRVRRIAKWGAEGRAGGRPGAWHGAARLCLRPLQDQTQGRREAAGQAQRHDRGRRCRSRAQGLRDARGDRRRRADGARSGQRAGQRALSGGIRPPRRRAEKSSASRSKCSTSRR